jgi:hypothetical protein
MTIRRTDRDAATDLAQATTRAERITNRAGIPMPGVARADSANGPNGPSEVDRICRYACTQKVF